jgi:hypothetical protein
MKTIDDNEFVEAESEAVAAFERVTGVAAIRTKKAQVGNRTFLQFLVGKEAPVYTYALREIQRALSPDNAYLGALEIKAQRTQNFPASPESKALLSILARSTREVSQGADRTGYVVPYIPFQNQEDLQLIQPATHIVRGRRGVGKSTLFRRAVDILRSTAAIVCIIDMQAYTSLAGDDLLVEIIHDVCQGFADSIDLLEEFELQAVYSAELRDLAGKIIRREQELASVPIAVKRLLTKTTKHTGSPAILFLDDFHLIDRNSQPELLHILHGCLKGANGWLKIAGLSTLLNNYDPTTRRGLQVPGDAQFISLDLTLTNPEAAEAHLQAILETFLKAVGYSYSSVVISPTAFTRLVWANAGVPRDFLQMFARSLEHAQRNRHATVTLSDVNIAIGEFGQQKMDDLQLDARNEAGTLRHMLTLLEELCLAKRETNAFLVKCDESKERELVHALADLRMVHMIHQSITPGKAGERFEAYILDYSLFTGFRRRRNVKEMVPAETQFKASELRALPTVRAGFFETSAT